MICEFWNLVLIEDVPIIFGEEGGSNSSDFN